MEREGLKGFIVFTIVISCTKKKIEQNVCNKEKKTIIQ